MRKKSSLPLRRVNQQPISRTTELLRIPRTEVGFTVCDVRRSRCQGIAAVALIPVLDAGESIPFALTRRDAQLVRHTGARQLIPDDTARGHGIHEAAFEVVCANAGHELRSGVWQRVVVDIDSAAASAHLSAACALHGATCLPDLGI